MACVSDIPLEELLPVNEHTGIYGGPGTRSEFDGDGRALKNEC